MAVSISKTNPDDFKAMRQIAHIIHRVVYYGCIIGMIFLLIMMLLTAGDVLGRAILTRPIPGSYEVSGYMLAIIVLLGLGYAQQAEANVRVEFFTDKMPRKVQGFLVAFFAMVASIFFSLVVWQGVKESLNTLKVGSTSDILHIPAFPFQFLVAVGALFLASELLIKFISTVYQLAKGTYHKKEMGKDIQGLD
jgi:TRAP-type C4-dicarboxylate transport system permease small subunit